MTQRGDFLAAMTAVSGASTLPVASLAQGIEKNAVTISVGGKSPFY